MGLPVILVTAAGRFVVVRRLDSWAAGKPGCGHAREPAAGKETQGVRWDLSWPWTVESKAGLVGFQPWCNTNPAGGLLVRGAGTLCQ